MRFEEGGMLSPYDQLAQLSFVMGGLMLGRAFVLRQPDATLRLGFISEEDARLVPFCLEGAAENKDIANQLYQSESAVKNTKSTLYHKLGIADLGRNAGPAAPRRIIESGLASIPEPDGEEPRLPERATEVLTMISYGHSIEETAKKLHLAVSTAREHMIRTRAGMGVHKTAHAVSQGFSWGLLKPDVQIFAPGVHDPGNIQRAQAHMMSAWKLIMGFEPPTGIVALHEDQD